MSCARLVAAFLVAVSPWLAVAADKTIDSEHSTLKIHVGKAGLFSAAGHEHWATAPLAEGSFNDSDSPHVAFTVDARKLRLLEDNKLSAEQQAEDQRTMQAKVLRSEIYPLISFHSTKVEKNGVNRWIVSGELMLHGQSRPILAQVHDSAEGYIGHSKIKQTDFGINPVSIAGGVVKVKDELEIQFVIVPIRLEEAAVYPATYKHGSSGQVGGYGFTTYFYAECDHLQPRNSAMPCGHSLSIREQPQCV